MKVLGNSQTPSVSDELIDGRSFTDEEKSFQKAVIPTVPPGIARSFFDGGRWIRAEAGHFLTLEGEVSGRLIYLTSGSAEVRWRGKLVGQCEKSSFIGEITALDGGPATATVMLLEHSLYFVIQSSALKKLCFANPELRLSLERAMAMDTRKKLLAANEKQNRRS